MLFWILSRLLLPVLFSFLPKSFDCSAPYFSLSFFPLYLSFFTLDSLHCEHDEGGKVSRTSGSDGKTDPPRRQGRGMTNKVRRFTVLSSRSSSRRQDIIYYHIAASRAALLNIYEGDRDCIQDSPTSPRMNDESRLLTLGIFYGCVF